VDTASVRADEHATAVLGSAQRSAPLLRVMRE
jgi:hypothetical protein